MNYTISQDFNSLQTVRYAPKTFIALIGHSFAGLTTPYGFGGIFLVF